jgi:flagellar hook-associated protein FlgK
LKLIPDPTDNALKSLVIAQSGMDLGLDFSSIGGGELAGLLRFQTQDLDSVRDQVGFMALAVANVVNNQHKLGLDASGSPAGPLFTIPVISGAASPPEYGCRHREGNGQRPHWNQAAGLRLHRQLYIRYNRYGHPDV